MGASLLMGAPLLIGAPLLMGGANIWQYPFKLRHIEQHIYTQALLQATHHQIKSVFLFSYFLELVIRAPLLIGVPLLIGAPLLMGAPPNKHPY